MAEMSEQFLQNQTEMLREIRDELRQGRAQAGMVGGASSGRTFTQAQAAMDRTLSGEWNSLGWSNAYSSTYRSSFIGDLAAVTGFQRAPETLTQQEFQALAGQSIWGRVGSAATGLIAPVFNSRANALADEIYSHSGRFIRFGSNQAGVTGAGFNYDIARSLGRQVSLEALGDLRLSQKDYSTITSLGMQAGQFDQVGGADDFKRKVRELASATGDLTRALHMTVQEVGTAMGNMRMLGVTNVGQQRQMLMQAGTSAMVAGMSAPEMLAFAGNVASTGMTMGIGAQSGFGLGANNMAMVRSMSASGLLQHGLLAMGGGAAAVAANISQAQLAFAGSNAGMLAFMGGGGSGGNSIEAMLRGLGRAGGSFEDMVNLGYDRVKNLSGMTGDDISALFAGRIRTQLGMVGVDNMTSRTAQGMAFRMARSMGMEDAAAHVFVQSQFSEEGLRNADITRMQGRRAEAYREHAVEYDKYLYRNSASGKVRASMQKLGGFFGSMVDAVGNWFGDTQSSSFARDFDAAKRGLLAADDTQFAQLFETLHGGASTMLAPSAISMRGSADFSVQDAHAAIPQYVTGWNAYANFAGQAYSAHVAGSVDQKFTDTNDVKNMYSVIKSAKTGSSPAVQSQINSGIYKGKNWEKVVAKLDRSKMSANEFRDFSNDIAAFASESGVSVADALGAAQAVGVDLVVPDALVMSGGTALDATGTDAIEKLLGDSRRLTNMASPGNSAAMRNYMQAVLANGSTTGIDAKLQQEAFKAVGASADFERIRDRLSAEVSTTEGRGRIATAVAQYGGVIKSGVTAQLNSMYGAARAFAGDLTGRSGFDKNSAAAIGAQLSLVDEGKLSFSDALDSGALGEAARGGKLGKLFKDASSVASASDLANMSAMQIAKTYHLDPSNINMINDAKSKDPAALRRSIQASILSQEAVERQQVNDQPVRAAQLLNDASRILSTMKEQLKL